MAEYYHVVPNPGDYDPGQRALIARYPEYDLSQLGRGVHYMDIDPATEPSSPDPVPVPSPDHVAAPKERIPVTVYFGDESIQAVTPDHLRAVRWVGASGNPMSGELSEALGKLRRLGTVALLGDPTLQLDRVQLQRLLVEAEVPTGHFKLVMSALRTWWRHQLRIAGRELIVSEVDNRHAWQARANPDMDFTQSKVPLVEGYGRKARRIELSTEAGPGIIDQDA